MLEPLMFDGQRSNTIQQQHAGFISEQHFDRHIQDRLQSVQAMAALHLEDQHKSKKKKRSPLKGEKSDIRQSIEAMKAQILAVKRLENSGVLKSEF